MNEQQIQEILQSIDLNSIAESVRMACIGCLKAIEEIIPIIKKNLENDEMSDYIKQELARRIVDELEG